MAAFHYLEIITRMREVSWDELVPGQAIYYLIKKHKPPYAHGPFTVVDPGRRRLRNGQGVEIDFFDNIQPLVIDELPEG